MKRVVEILYLIVVVARASLAQSAGPSPEHMRTIAGRVSELEVRRQLASATPATIDSLLSLYTDSVVYEHPNASAIVRGKAVMRGAMADYFSSIRAVRADPPHVTVGHGVAIVETNVRMEVKDEAKWVPVTRHSLRVIEFDARGLVRRIIDYPW